MLEPRWDKRSSAAGHKVWGLKRHPADLPSSIQPLAADLTDPATLTVLPPKVDAVVYSAAAAGFSEAHYQAAYVEGVRNLLNALRQAGQHPQRLLFTSSTSVYAQHQGEWVDEDSPAEADGFSGRCIREGERLMWDSGWPAVAVRFGGIYGPGRTRLIDSVRDGQRDLFRRSTDLHQPYSPRRLRPGAGTSTETPQTGTALHRRR